MSNEINISEILNSKVFKPIQIHPSAEKRRQMALLIAIKETIGFEKTPAYRIIKELTSNYASFDECLSKLTATINIFDLLKKNDSNVYSAIGSQVKNKLLNASSDYNFIEVFTDTYQTSKYHKSTQSLQEDLMIFKSNLTAMKSIKDIYPNEYLTNLDKNQHLPNIPYIRSLIINAGFPFYSPEDNNNNNISGTLMLPHHKNS